jgi:GNAT superfamily N-acetyltransferase
VSNDALFGLASSAVDIRVIDDVAQKDDELMRELYDLNRRSEMYGRPESTHWDFEEFLGAVRSSDSGERQEMFAGYDGDTMVATAFLWSFLLDNTEKAYTDINVDLPARRRGMGRALVEHVEGIVRADGRTLLLASAHLPFDDREDHAYRKFAEACGFELSNIEVSRHLTLPIPDERIQEWIDDAAPAHEGYTIETYVGAVPDDLVDSLCVILSQLAVDAPTGAVDFEEETMNPQRYAEMVTATAAMGRARYETVALTPDRQVVAQSTLGLSLKENTTVYQWGTFVHREHRGHRLGLATKAVNLRAVQAARDDLTRVTTQNAETNDYMVSINERIGFRPIEVHAEFVKRF